MFLSPKKIIQELDLKSGDIIADFGCGNGAFILEISPLLGNEGKIFAIDNHLNILDKLHKEKEKKFLDNLEIIYNDLTESVYIEDGVCDFVLLANILHEIEKDKLEKVITEAKRILKDNSYLVVIDWKEKEHILNQKRNILKEEEILALLGKYNFEIKRHLGAGDFHYAFMGKFL